MTNDNALSASVQTSVVNSISFLNTIPLPGFALRYWRSYKLHSRALFGSCMNRLPTPTTYAISGLVWHRKISLPTSLWYLPLSTAPSSFLPTLWFGSTAILDALSHSQDSCFFKQIQHILSLGYKDPFFGVGNLNSKEVLKASRDLLSGSLEPTASLLFPFNHIISHHNDVIHIDYKGNELTFFGMLTPDLPISHP